MIRRINVKVLFNTHSTAYQMFGGMEVQMINTKLHLEKLGIFVKNYDMYNDKLDNFDILHTFGSYSYETVPMVNLMKNKNKIVVGPKNWFNFSDNDLDIMPKEWIKL